MHDVPGAQEEAAAEDPPGMENREFLLSETTLRLQGGGQSVPRHQREGRAAHGRKVEGITLFPDLDRNNKVKVAGQGAVRLAQQANRLHSNRPQAG